MYSSWMMITKRDITAVANTLTEKDRWVVKHAGEIVF